MKTSDSQRLDRLQRRVQELGTWRNARVQPIPEWEFTAPDGRTHALRLDDPWPVVDLPVRLRASVAAPAAWAGEPLEADLWLGGEGYVEIRTSAGRDIRGGLDPFHRAFPLSAAARGETVEIEAEVVPKGMFGSHVASPSISTAALVVPDEDVRDLERDLLVLVDACTSLDDHEVVPFLLDALDDVFASLSPSWPSGTDETLTRFLESPADPFGGTIGGAPGGIAREAGVISLSGKNTWSLPDSPAVFRPLPDEARQAVREARASLSAHLEWLKGEYPPNGHLALTGHAHIDLAWLWPMAETHRKGRRTFASVLQLMDRYPEFTFNQSSAQLYRWIEEDDPALFECIRQRVAEGRWEPVGGAWLEPDSQVTGGESYVRHLLYGQRYFEEKFGQRHSVAWLPDIFGFSPGVPQLLRGAGLTGFFTIKVNWNETNTFPYDLFEWEGLDGSSVVAHTFNNPGQGYNGNITPFDLLHTWRNYRSKTKHLESLLSFGWGDGGGGPSERMLENYARLQEFPALPRLRMARVEEYYAELPREGLPKWVGELYLELHRGTLTTQGKVKKLNREGEHRLLEAEAFGVIAGLEGYDAPNADLEETWKTLLFQHFHDVLPGSSIKEVYEDTHRQLEEVVDAATRERDRALCFLAERVDAPEGTSQVVLVGNAGLAPRPFSAIVALPPGTVLTDERGEAAPTQATEDGLLVHALEHTVAGLGYGALFVGVGAEHSPNASPPPDTDGVRAEDTGDGAVIENELLRVVIGADGSIAELWDKQAGRDAFDGRGNQLWAYTDKPREWDAWDIDASYEQEGEEVGGVERIAVTEEGPLRASVRVERAYRSSRIAQTYRLLSGSRRLDVETHIELHDRRVLLRAVFPLAVRSHEAAFETLYGTQRRPTHRNTSWDEARFEVSAHRFADVSETGYGVALLNDGKYGHSVHGNVLGLSLVRSPMYPDHLADEGEHRFTYSVMPHLGDWTEAGVVEEAFALNSPLRAVVAAPAGTRALDGQTAAGFGLVSVEGVPLALGSLKAPQEGEGFVLRVHEPRGERGTSILRFSRPVRSAELLNLLEDGEGELPVEGGAVELDVRPFEVLTLRVVV